MKTFINKIIALTVFLSALLPASAYGFMVDGLAYDIVSTGDLTCRVVPADQKYEGDIIIPEKVTYRGREFRVVDFTGFQNCEGLTSIVIPPTCSWLTDCFAGCVNLKSVSLPKTIKGLQGTFFNCRSLKAITLPDSIVCLGMRENGSFQGAFEGCSSLVEIVIPHSVTEIDERCFIDCRTLVSVNIPPKVERLPYRCFENCTALKRVTFECDTCTIGRYCFSGCTSLETIELPQTLKGIGEAAFRACSSLKKISLPLSVTDIGNLCFAECSELNDVNLGSITQIPSGAFRNCTNLTSLIIPSSVYWLSLYTCSDLSNDIIKTFENVPLNTLTIESCADGWLPVGYYKYEKDIHSAYRYEYKWHQISRSQQQDLVYADFVAKLEHLDINRLLADGLRLDVPNLKTLSFNMAVEDVDKSIYQTLIGLDKLEYIQVKSLEPEPFDKNRFSAKQYMDLQVIVPDSSIDAYKQDASWKNFWNIMTESEFRAGIREVAADSEKVEVARYDMQGRPVGENYTGVMIIKYSDGTTKKVSRL
ncbi:MAG: leucine-rich repeat protein [Muribaculaceae bacterium]|nr:leucine-rich repeat protein [Muribaculaceae bacterium]